MSPNVPGYAMFAGDIIANEVSHHQQIWVERPTGAKPHILCYMI